MTTTKQRISTIINSKKLLQVKTAFGGVVGSSSILSQQTKGLPASTGDPPDRTPTQKVDEKSSKKSVTLTSGAGGGSAGSQPPETAPASAGDPPERNPSQKVDEKSSKKSGVSLSPKTRHFLRSCTDIHTTPSKLIIDLLNPNSSIILNGIKKSGGGEGVPPSRIVYDSTTIVKNTASLAIEDLDNNNSNVDGKAPAAGGENNKRTVVMAFYRASPTKKNQLLEFLRKYETWGLEGGGVVIGFCTIKNPKDLPPGSVAPEEYQKGITDGK